VAGEKADFRSEFERKGMNPPGGANVFAAPLYPPLVRVKLKSANI